MAESVFSGSRPVVQTLLVVRDAERAIAFYTSVFGATEVWRVMHFHRVGHAILRIGRSEIIVLDEFAEANIVGPETAEIGVAAPRLLLEIDDVDVVLDRAVAEGAELLKVAEDQWWGVRAGSIRDPFGYRWNIHSVIEELTEAEIQRRSDELGLYPPPQPTSAARGS
jgi:PhnB protein